jgi:predicted component of type VI protein secretion system
MVTLRLFHSADPFRPIAERTLGGDEIQVGRDPAADWPVEDAACELSRRHCALRLTASGVIVRDMSANGVFIGRDRKRLQRDVDTALPRDATIHLGQFIIALDWADAVGAPANDHASVEGAGIDAPFHSPMLREPALSARDFEVRSVWTEVSQVAAPSRLPDAVLLEAFCDGAGIDPSLFAGEDPGEVLRRAGVAYQQTVLGLCDLMSERTSLKTEYKMDRTTVSAENNNPFKWTEPQRVAVDLLRSGNGAFLGDGAAITQSFQDLKKHLLCLMAGSRAAVAALFEEMAPRAIEAGLRSNALMLQSKPEACWRAFRDKHAALVADATDNPQSGVNQAFKQGYERQVRKFDGLGTVS